MSSFYDPNITNNPAVVPYDASEMTLKAVLTVLINYCYTFEQLREMNMLDICEAINKVNRGELKTYAEKRAEEMQARKAGKR